MICLHSVDQGSCNFLGRIAEVFFCQIVALLYVGCVQQRIFDSITFTRQSHYDKWNEVAFTSCCRCVVTCYRYFSFSVMGVYRQSVPKQIILLGIDRQSVPTKNS